MIWPLRKPKPTPGDLKGLEDVTLSDFDTHPIWVTDLSGEGAAGFDETAQRPVLECTDVTKQMLKQFVDVSVAINVTDTDFRGSANIDRNLGLSCIAIWHDGKWKNPKNIATFPDGADVRAVPTINGQERKYRHITGTDRAE